MIVDSRLELMDNVDCAMNIGGPTVKGSQIDLTGAIGFKYITANTGATVNANITTNYPANDDEALYLVMNCTATGTGASGVVTFTLSDGTDAALSSPTTKITIGPFTIGSAQLTVGGNMCIVQLPRGAYQRFLGLYETVATTNVAALKCDAFLTKDPGQWIAAADSLVKDANY
jgi:hypothetical protein